MALLDDIQAYARTIGAEIKGKGERWEMTKLVAERKAFLSRKKLLYLAKFEIDDAAKELRFREMLKESGAGLEGGSGFQTETYRTKPGSREGSIEEQSRLFGKTYAFQFEFGAVRDAIKRLAESAGYRFAA
jgi:hypothetical protein